MVGNAEKKDSNHGCSGNGEELARVEAGTSYEEQLRILVAELMGSTSWTRQSRVGQSTVKRSVGAPVRRPQTAVTGGGSTRLKGTWICRVAVVSRRNVGTWPQSVSHIGRRGKQRFVAGVTFHCSATVSARRVPGARRGTIKCV